MRLPKGEAGLASKHKERTRKSEGSDVDPSMLSSSIEAVHSAHAHGALTALEILGGLLVLVGLFPMSADQLPEGQLEKLDSWVIARLRRIGGLRRANDAIRGRRDRFLDSLSEEWVVALIGVVGAVGYEGLRIMSGPAGLPDWLLELLVRAHDFFLGLFPRGWLVHEVLWERTGGISAFNNWWVVFGIFAVGAALRRLLRSLPWPVALAVMCLLVVTLVPSAMLRDVAVWEPDSLDRLRPVTTLLLTSLLVATAWLFALAVAFAAILVGTLPVRFAIAIQRRYRIPSGVRFIGLLITALGLVLTLVAVALK